jgi:hypothetical protein
MQACISSPSDGTARAKIAYRLVSGDHTMKLKTFTIRLGVPLLSFLAMIAALAAGCMGPSVTGSFDRTLNMNGPVELELQNGSGDVRIRSGQAGQVRIRGDYSVWGFETENARREADDLREHPPVEQFGNTVQVGLTGWKFRQARIDYTIYVPDETQARLKVGSGRIEIAGITGPAEIESGSGSVEAREIKQDVRAQTGSGEIILEDIGGPSDVRAGSGSLSLVRIGGDVVAQSGSGRISVDHPSGGIDISGASGDLRAATGSGTVRVTGNPAADRYWEIESGSGGVSLDVPREASLRLYAHANSGRIHTDLPLTIEQQENSHSVRGRVGSGAARVEITTHSGGIEIR